MSTPRFLVLRGGAIGDFVLTLPAIQAIRERWPEAHIEIIGYPHIANLALTGGLANKVSSLDDANVARLFSLRPALPTEQQEYIQSFDVIITYLYDPFQTVTQNMRSAGAKHVIYGSPRFHAGHAIDHLLKPLVELAIFGEGTEYPHLVLQESYTEYGKKWSEHAGPEIVMMHPGSGSPQKNWPIQKFAALATRVVEELGIKVVLSLGEADETAARSLKEMKCGLPILSGCSLVELASALSFCKGYVGNDSGITHIAAALGIPVVALYGPTDPEAWGPRGPNVKTIHASERGNGGLTGIKVAEVFKKLNDLLECSRR